MMAKLLLIWGLVLGVLGWEMEYPVGGVKEKAILPLVRFDFDSLKKRGGVVGEIKILGRIKEVEERRKDRGVLQYALTFNTRQISFISEGKRITGMISAKQNFFNDGSKHAVIIMIRGYADKAGYYSGFGTWKVADELAKNGFITISLDFLGYGGSDGESEDILEARFEKVVSVSDLIESVKRLEFVDKERIGIWAHSNGGQIAISVLEITGENYPTVLWAPMTSPFPQSVLETADDLDDGGITVKKVIAEFEKRYDSRRYAFENYLAWIQAPITIYQGTADEWCKVEWQEKLVGDLEALGKAAELRILAGDDHNLKKSWEEVVGENVEWYRKYLF